MSRFFAVIFLTFFLESEALSISKETVAEPSEVLEPRTFSSEVVDLGATYDYLTNSDTSYLFLLVLAFQVNIRKYYSYSPPQRKVVKNIKIATLILGMLFSKFDYLFIKFTDACENL